MTYFPSVVRGLDAIKNANDPLLHAVEALSAAQTAFTTNGSGSRAHIEAARRHVKKVAAWAEKTLDAIDDAESDIPAVQRTHLAGLNGGKAAPRTPTSPGLVPSPNHSGTDPSAA